LGSQILATSATERSISVRLGLAGLTAIQGAAEVVPEPSTTVFIAAGMSLLAIMLRRGNVVRMRLTESPPPQLAAEGNQRCFCQRRLANQRSGQVSLNLA